MNTHAPITQAPRVTRTTIFDTTENGHPEEGVFYGEDLVLVREDHVGALGTWFVLRGVEGEIALPARQFARIAAAMFPGRK